MNVLKALLGPLTGAILAVGLLAGPAQAAQQAGEQAAPPAPTHSLPADTPVKITAEETCPYPYVCFYNSQGHITGKFQDVTYPAWQWLTASKGAYMGRNTRHDDIVYYHFTNGQTICSPPQTTYFFNSWVVDGVSISWSATC